jgi:hypothetical protein
MVSEKFSLCTYFLYSLVPTKAAFKHILTAEIVTDSNETMFKVRSDCLFNSWIFTKIAQLTLTGLPYVPALYLLADFPHKAVRKGGGR